MKYLKILYHFKSIKFKQFKNDHNLLYETVVNLNIKGKCHGTFITNHKYILFSWFLMFKKLPNMIHMINYYI